MSREDGEYGGHTRVSVTDVTSVVMQGRRKVVASTKWMWIRMPEINGFCVEA